MMEECAKNVAIKTENFLSKPFLWKGFSLYAIDGSTLTMEDTVLNQAKFPQHGNQEEGVGFPIARAVILQCLSTGMIRNASYGSYKGKETGEMSLARPLINDLSPGDLLLGDRYYPSYFTMAQLQKNGVAGVFQIQGARNYDFRTGQKLGDLEHIVYWDKPVKPKWMTQDEYDSIPNQIKIREVDITKEVNSEERIVLVTTLLDPIAFSKNELAELYKRRWEIETALKELKDTMGLHHINAKTPASVELTIWSTFLSYNLLKWYMLNIAILADRQLREISLSATIYVLIANAATIASADIRKIPTVRASIIIQILSKKVLHRPGRSEPREVKKRPKPHKRMQVPRKAWKERKLA